MNIQFLAVDIDIEFDKRDKANDYWEDARTQGNETPQECAERIVKYFNDTLRPGEIPRKVVGVREAQGSYEKPIEYRHDWGKTNLITIKKGNRYFDKYKCKYCPATAKRYGIGGDFIIDGRYKFTCKGQVTPVNHKKNI